MTDERFMFNQTVAERRKDKTGAYHKKSGARSKKCTLPSDKLTKRQKEKLSGPVTRICMSEPYTDWKEFRKLPVDIQSEYMQNLIDRYGAKADDIGGMFNVAAGTIYHVCNRYPNKVKFKRVGRIDKGMTDGRFTEFLASKARVNMDIPYRNWDEFRKFPENDQSAYLQNLVDMYGARAPDIAEMFNVKTIVVRNACHGYSTPVKFNGLQKYVDERFTAFLLGTIKEEQNEEVIEMEVPNEAPESVLAEAAPPLPLPLPYAMRLYSFMPMVSGTITASGKAEEIMQMLCALMKEGDTYTVTIDIKKGQ